MAIKVLVVGSQGRMGSLAIDTFTNANSCQLVGGIDLGDNLDQALASLKPQVAVDLTHPSSVFNNAQTIIAAKVHPLIGTTGLSTDQISSLSQACAAASLGGLIIPNFAIGAVLMMQFSRIAARFIPHAEIIELHHDQKAEAPSGTAIKTAQLIADGRKTEPQRPAMQELEAGALGADYLATPIHAVRLPGHVAHQEVVFGARGESLRIRHDAIDRQCFMSGLLLATEKVIELKQMYYGLEHILFPDGNLYIND